MRVLGEFPLADDDTIIPFEMVEASLKRDVAPTLTREVWVLDCARFGRDKSALARRRGNTLVEPVETREGKDTMQLVGWVKSLYDSFPKHAQPEVILIDVIGIGAGVVDRCRELNLPVRGTNVAESAGLTDRYKNLRTELWFRGRDWFNQRNTNLAGDEKLMAELPIASTALK